MKLNSRPSFAIISLAFWVLGCAGPTTPFGAVHTIKKPSKKSFLEARKTHETIVKPSTPRMYFYPQKQVLHTSSDLIIQIQDPKGVDYGYQFHIYYNGYDVTNSISLQRKDSLQKDKNQILITIPKLKIQADRENDIQFVYARNSRATPIMSTFEKPSCSIYENHRPRMESNFRVPASYVESINLLSTEAKYNPSFFAGLIAQESSFDPKAVSWAKAIGLTQITNVAEEEIIRDYPHWPRNPKIGLLNYAYLKTMIFTGKINEKNEWRLDPMYSMRGGISYLQYLDNYWRRTQNINLIKSVYSNLDQGLTEVIAASYNSGSSRVRRALETKGYNWINDEELGEAKKYINRISSYCYHFAERE